ncbi:hypothetical protein, partial [Phytobacter sp. V91]|uniref:hypothetical protein n=1 Tax=Phytobacter sp. V91 TaxID=3369425 RepID=UPI003F61972D
IRATDLKVKPFGVPRQSRGFTGLNYSIERKRKLYDCRNFASSNTFKKTNVFCGERLEKGSLKVGLFPTKQLLVEN